MRRRVRSSHFLFVFKHTYAHTVFHFLVNLEVLQKDLLILHISPGSELWNDLNIPSCVFLWCLHSETFSFVLTGEDGSRWFCYCRKILVSVSNTKTRESNELRLCLRVSAEPTVGCSLMCLSGSESQSRKHFWNNDNSKRRNFIPFFCPLKRASYPAGAYYDKQFLGQVLFILCLVLPIKPVLT